MPKLSLEALGWRNFFLQQLSMDEFEQCVPARVMGVERSQLQLVTEQGVTQLSLDRSWQALPAAERPTVGDWLLLPLQDEPPLRLLERQSLFKRRAAGPDATQQLIAANVDTLFIVSSCNADFNLSRIERYLALAMEAQVTPVVVLTKADLVADETRSIASYVQEAEALHPVLVAVAVNALASNAQETLAPWCAPGQTIALLGSSGVGKSTLLNLLMQEQVQSTGAIREDDAKGRHTTTSRSLHYAPNGVLVLDSPGMRELQLTDVREGIQDVFSDVAELALTCRFGDCEHASEPGCAVQQAITAGDLDQRRLSNYQKLLREEAHNNMTIAERHAKNRAFARLVKQHSGGNKRRPF